MQTPRLAATVCVLRPQSDGFRVFMVQRHRKSGFMPDAWVFPGGRVDDADRVVDHPALRGGESVLSQLGLPPQDGRAILVAAVRETFEEAGIWLGDGELPQEARMPLTRGELGLFDLLARTDASIDLDHLASWAWWVTPKVEPRRYDTRFLVTIARSDHVLARHDDHETVESAWYTPAEAIAGAERGEIKLAPPTWWTLKELASFSTADDVLAAAPYRPQRPVQPVLRKTDGAWTLVLPGHAEHPEPAIEGLPTCIEWVQGRWWARR